METVYYIEVIVPLRLAWVPVYSSQEALAPGTRVSVRFARREYSGVVWHSNVAPGMEPSRIQSILRIESELPAISAQELSFWEFISNYYLCSTGEVFKAAYPSGRIKGEKTAAHILERLESRLAIRQEALSKKHKDSVRERLEAERDSIAAQIAALTRIPQGSAPKTNPGKPLLLTGAGREQEYLRLCREATSAGFNALVITPGIAVSEQLEALFESNFPGTVHRCNSGITEARRRRIAEDLRNFGGQCVVGTRSSLFLPFSRLGLIIVDNEQDPFLKQTEPSPRYHARDAAVMLARIHGAKVVLGTPAPSLESLHNVQTGKYEMRGGNGTSGEITLIDLAAERRKNGLVGRLSRKLIEAAAQTTGPIALIRGWEKPEELLQNAESALPGREIDIFTLQQARLSRLNKYALVAVVQADALMSAEDFRADERALQAIALLREATTGVFIVQTEKAAHPVFGERSQVYAHLLQERQEFALPPFTRLIDTDFGGHKERITVQPGPEAAHRKQELLTRARDFEARTHRRVIIDVDPV